MSEALGQEIRQFIIEQFLFGQGGQDLADDDSFLEKGIIESTRVLELITFIEETYTITVEDEEIIPENLDSINILVDFITRKQNQ